jgi:Transmembrane protein 65
MIQAGSVIDNTLGVQLGLATMTAAALGQVVSDTCGVLFGGTLERLMVVPPAKLTDAQKRLAVIPRLRLASAVGGVIVGCLLGACTLLLLPDRQSTGDSESTSSSTARLRLQGVLNDMMINEQGSWLNRGTLCTLYVNESATQILSPSQNSSIVASIAQLSAGDDSIAFQCAEACKVLTDRNTIYFPVMDRKEDTVLGVLKLTQDDNRGPEMIFTKAEMHEVEQMARHIGIFMKHMQSD